MPGRPFPKYNMAFDLDRVRRLIREQADGLAGRLSSLSDADWERSTACAEWNVGDVVAHLASGVVVQRQSLRRGLEGETSPVFRDAAARAAITEAKRDLPPSRKAADYRQEMVELLALFDTLSPSDLETPAWHQSGVHPVRWFLLQRLGETTFHRGDIHHGLGDAISYPPDVAEVLLPAYLGRLPRLLQPQATDDDLTATIRFSNAGAVRIADGHAEYSEHDLPRAADLRLEAEPATLLLVATGRLHPRDALSTGQLGASGDTALVERWREIFRPL